MSPGFFPGLREELVLPEVLLSHIKGMGWKDQNQGRFNRVSLCQKWKGFGWCLLWQMNFVHFESLKTVTIRMPGDGARVTPINMKVLANGRHSSFPGRGLQVATATEWSREGSQAWPPCCIVSWDLRAMQTDQGQHKQDRTMVKKEQDWSLEAKSQHDHSAFCLYTSGFM